MRIYCTLLTATALALASTAPNLRWFLFGLTYGRSVNCISVAGFIGFGMLFVDSGCSARVLWSRCFNLAIARWFN